MQTKLQSLLETIFSTLVGMVVALITQVLVFPLFGFTPKISENIAIALIFTVVSVLRGFLVRRLFNWLHHKQGAAV